MGLTASRFWRLQPLDMEEMVVVHRRQVERQRERDAWMVYHIMAALIGSKKTPTIDQLLGRSVRL